MTDNAFRKALDDSAIALGCTGLNDSFHAALDEYFVRSGTEGQLEDRQKKIVRAYIAGLALKLARVKGRTVPSQDDVWSSVLFMKEDGQLDECSGAARSILASHAREFGPHAAHGFNVLGAQVSHEAPWIPGPLKAYIRKI